MSFGTTFNPENKFGAVQLLSDGISEFVNRFALAVFAIDADFLELVTDLLEHPHQMGFGSLLRQPAHSARTTLDQVPATTVRERHHLGLTAINQARWRAKDQRKDNYVGHPFTSSCCFLETRRPPRLSFPGGRCDAAVVRPDEPQLAPARTVNARLQFDLGEAST